MRLTSSVASSSASSAASDSQSMSSALPWLWLLCAALPVPALPCLRLPIDLLAVALRLQALELAGLGAFPDSSMSVSECESDKRRLCPEHAWVLLICFFKRLHPALPHTSAIQYYIKVQMNYCNCINIYSTEIASSRPQGELMTCLTPSNVAVQQVQRLSSSILASLSVLQLGISQSVFPFNQIHMRSHKMVLMSSTSQGASNSCDKAISSPCIHVQR